MGRHQTIFVDRRKLLRGIAEAITQAVAAIDRKIAKQGFTSPLVLAERNQAFEPMQNLELWAGRELTPSERLRHQEAIRKLEDDGLVERNRPYLRLTPEGWRKSGIDPPPAQYQPPAKPDAAKPDAAKPDAAQPDAARKRRWKSDAERMTAQRQAARDVAPGPVSAPSLFGKVTP